MRLSTDRTAMVYPHVQRTLKFFLKRNLMVTTIYATDASNEIYSTKAIKYISNQSEFIINAASIIGVSAGAIAGAMAEECNAYFKSKTDVPLDRYAQSGMDPIAFA